MARNVVLKKGRSLSGVHPVGSTVRLVIKRKNKPQPKIKNRNLVVHGTDRRS